MSIILFSDIKPSWKMLPFNEGKGMIPAPERKWRENSNSPIIFPMMIGDRLVFRKFQFPEGVTKRQDNAKELSRFVFYGANIIREDADGSWKFITVDALQAENEYYDCYKAMSYFAWEALLREFTDKAVIANKRYILMAMKLVRENERFMLSSFQEIYRIADRESRELQGIPDRIVKELCGRSMPGGIAVRIAKDLVVVTGESKLPLLNLTEQTRAYFDGSRAFFFRKSPLTKSWLVSGDTEYFRYDKDMRERYIDRDLFENTCMERFVPGAIEHKFKGNKKVNYGHLMAQAVFLSAEQAFKVSKRLYFGVIANIFAGRITDGKLALPELLGITGSQVKFMDDINIPFNLNEFANCMRDPEFNQYYPDVKKRMFATSIFLKGADSYFVTWSLTRQELFEAAKTFNSLEKIADHEKKDKLIGEYLDYIKMRRTYLQHVSQMQDSDPLFEEITKFGEAPISIKPSIIKDRHDKLGKIIDIIQCSDQINKYTEAIRRRKEKEAKDREYRAERYSVIMPRDALDIITEGRKLEHCVGRAGYIESMAGNGCTILFVRDNNHLEEPLITMEEKQGVICQCYGFRDSYNHDPEIGQFIKDYAALRNLKIQTTIYSPIEKAG
ncbi:hypothetical protein D6855_05395 [Butyrivibrio sp. CB08]|uniref:PcfJ domain-containing protein n=1 Tax=Butyrivibrio sp. CB08 TaxID=2364879 RepID=UPI000EA93D45|nr:PcfJ domain-containing protein [Butyrivibrio sp. CB08]RKM61326.1 hypothetical protein D6855_05395 [Butyrivibrio sp. CB08]